MLIAEQVVILPQPVATGSMPLWFGEGVVPVPRDASDASDFSPKEYLRGKYDGVAICMMHADDGNLTKVERLTETARSDKSLHARLVLCIDKIYRNCFDNFKANGSN